MRFHEIITLLAGDEEKAKALLADQYSRMTEREIANIWRTSSSTVNRTLKRFGIRARKKGWRPLSERQPEKARELRRYLGLLETGKVSAGFISRKTGIPKATLSRELRRRGYVYVDGRWHRNSDEEGLSKV